MIVGSPEYEVRERRTELEREKTEETGRDRKMDLDTVEKLPFSKVEAYRICSRTGGRMYTGRQQQRMSFCLHMDIKIFTSQPMAILIWKIRIFPVFILACVYRNQKLVSNRRRKSSLWKWIADSG